MLKSALFGFVLACLGVVGLVCVFLFAPDMSATALAVLAPLITLGAGVAARSEPPGKSSPKGPTVLCVLAVCSVLGACTTTYTGEHARVDLRPLGASGLSALLSVDSKEVCRVNGGKSTLAVHKDTAKRVCAALPENCSWK